MKKSLSVQGTDASRNVKSSFGGRFSTVAAKQGHLSKAQVKDLREQLLISPKHRTLRGFGA